MRYYPFERNTHVGEIQLDVWNGRSCLGSFEFVGRRPLTRDFPMLETTVIVGRFFDRAADKVT